MQNLVRSISNSFIQEAISSPRMLEDLAAMEKYMSESYDGRTFVELIQNADDACATAIKVFTVSDALIVANSGRPFNKDDLMAICRSGSSNKQRGSSIGYRGVGFKSATTISNEIVIASAGALFTFSKALCSKALGKEPHQVPTVRIPFPYSENELPAGLVSAMRAAEKEGYTTFFIFLHANISKFAAELSGFDGSWLLFLNNICKIAIDLPTIHQTCCVLRSASAHGDKIVSVSDASEQWYIVSDDEVSIAFRYKDNTIVPCSNNEACFHCYLPTLDKMGYPFKVNADFSTDPSRKHLIWDDLTKQAFQKAEELYVAFITRILATSDVKLFPALSLVSAPICLSELSAKFENGIFQQLRIVAWVPLGEGKSTTPDKICLLPNAFTAEERELLVSKSETIATASPSSLMFQYVSKLEAILTRAGAKEITTRALSDLLRQIDTVRNLNAALSGKIFVYSCRGELGNPSLLENILIPCNDGSYCCLKEVIAVEQIDPDFLTALNVFTVREKNDFAEKFPVFTSLLKAPTLQTKSRSKIKLSRSATSDKGVDIAINKWKTPIQNAITLETLNGNSAKAAEKGCNEYDVISTKPDGSIVYITAKSVGVLGDSFALTENEYDAAVRYGSSYKIYLFTTATSNIKYITLEDPANTISMQKVVKTWEWVCNEYQSIENKDTQPSLTAHGNISQTDFDRMSGVQFEEFCAQILIKNGYEDVSLTPGSGDQGIDIIAYRDGVRYGIQCKCYSSDLGNGAVQEAFAGKSFYKCHVGIVFTNRHFSASAIQLAETNGIVLWGREMLLRMIKTAGLS